MYMPTTAPTDSSRHAPPSPSPPPSPPWEPLPPPDKEDASSSTPSADGGVASDESVVFLPPHLPSSAEAPDLTLMSVRDSSSGPSVAFHHLSELEHAQQASEGAPQLEEADHQPDAPLSSALRDAIAGEVSSRHGTSSFPLEPPSPSAYLIVVGRAAPSKCGECSKQADERPR